MMKTAFTITTFLLTLLTVGGLSADDIEIKTAAYFQSRAFNVPNLESWVNQSTDEVAQFYLAEAEATIRAATVPGDDVIVAAEADLAALTGARIPAPIYSDKVNLADGTWQVLAYDVDAESTASVMARRAGGRAVVISFVERDPAARTVMLTLAQADDGLADASPEIATAAQIVAGIDMTYLAPVGFTVLPSGEWIVYESDSAAMMGMVFGNDSFVALREGANGDLSTLADAYNRTLLGFFITPDNSNYLALGLAVVFVILGTLIGSLYWRERNLRKDLALLEQLAGEEG